MKLKTKKIVAALAVAAAAVAPTTARATGIPVVDAANLAVNNAMFAFLVEFYYRWEMLAGSLVGHNGTTVMTQGTIAAGQNDALANTMTEVAAYQAGNSYRSRGTECGDGVHSYAAPQAATNQDAVSRYLGQTPYGKEIDKVGGAMPVKSRGGSVGGWASKKGQAAMDILFKGAQVPEQAANAAAEAHKESFCDANDNNAYGCAIGPMAGASVDAKTLLQGPYAGIRGSSFYEDKEKDAALTLMTNITPAAVLNPPTRGSVRTEKGNRYVALYNQARASHSLSQMPMQDALASRLVVDRGASKKVVSWLMEDEDNKAFWKLFAAKSNLESKGAENGISPRDLLAFDVSRRYDNLDWIKSMSAAPAESVTKDIAYINAQQASLQFKMYEKLETTNILLGAIFGVLSRQEAREQAKNYQQ